MAANTFTNTYRDNFASTVEKLLGQFATYRALRGTEADEVLQSNRGQTYKYITLTENEVQSYTPYSDLTIDASTLSPDTLTLNRRAAYTFKLNDEDEYHHQASASFLSRQAESARKNITKDVEGWFFYTGTSQSSVNVFDDGDIGGTDGSAISWDQSNVAKVFTKAKATVRANSGEVGNDAIVLTPLQFSEIEQSGFSNGFKVADSTFRNGLMMNQNGYAGSIFDTNVFLSDYLPHSYTITYTGQPSNTETLVATVDGTALTYTAVSSIGTTAGNFLIGADADATYGALVTLINNNSTTATGVAQTERDARYLRAVQDTTAGTVTIYSVVGAYTLTESLSNASAGSQIVHNHFGKKGAIELAHPAGVRAAVREEPKQTTDNYISQVFYGSAVPTNNLQRYLDLQILA